MHTGLQIDGRYPRILANPSFGCSIPEILKAIWILCSIFTANPSGNPYDSIFKTYFKNSLSSPTPHYNGWSRSPPSLTWIITTVFYLIFLLFPLQEYIFNIMLKWKSDHCPSYNQNASMHYQRIQHQSPILGVPG